MTPEEAIADRLASLATVIAIVGTRVYTEKFPQGVTKPAVRVQLVDEAVPRHLRGPIGLKTARVQVDAIGDESAADPYRSVAALAEAIHGNGLGPQATGLEGFKGDIGSPPFTIRGCFRIDRSRRYDPDELRVLTMQQDYVVWYRPP